MNDVLLTAYARTLNRVTGCEKIAIPCPVDLRRYKAENQKCGICNLTGNYWCRVEITPNETFRGTLRKVSEQMYAQKESCGCLKGPMLYHIMFHSLPFPFIQKIFNRVSPVPITSYTNLGILDDSKLLFGNHKIADAFISTAVKNAPSFQLSASTYKGSCTLTSSFYGAKGNKKIIDHFLTEVKNQLESFIS